MIVNDIMYFRLRADYFRNIQTIEVVSRREKFLLLSQCFHICFLTNFSLDEFTHLHGICTGGL